MEPIRVEATVATQPALFSQPCWVEVTVTNQSSGPVLINGRLSIGYRNSINRELFAEVFRQGTDDVVSKDARLYQRDPARPQDYVSLGPGKSISTTFDLLKWYDLPGPGAYDLVVSYQADDSPDGHPADLLNGIHSSDRVPFDVT